MANPKFQPWALASSASSSSLAAKHPKWKNRVHEATKGCQNNHQIAKAAFLGHCDLNGKYGEDAENKETDTEKEMKNLNPRRLEIFSFFSCFLSLRFYFYIYRYTSRYFFSFFCWVLVSSSSCFPSLKHINNNRSIHNNNIETLSLVTGVTKKTTTEATTTDTATDTDITTTKTAVSLLSSYTLNLKRQRQQHCKDITRSSSTFTMNLSLFTNHLARLSLGLLLLHVLVTYTLAASINNDYDIPPSPPPHHNHPRHHHHHHHHQHHSTIAAAVPASDFVMNSDMEPMLASDDNVEDVFNQTVIGEDQIFVDDEEEQEWEKSSLVKRATVFSGDPFAIPISVNAPPDMFKRITHPLTPFETNDGKPIPTNKFYTNMLLGTRTNPAYTQPYAVWWAKTGSYLGLAISHTTRSQFVYGPDSSANPVEYVFAPAGIMSLIFGATQFNLNAVTMKANTPSDLSVNIVMARTSGSGSITFPLVQGMGFVTAVYSGLTPKIMSAVGFKSLTKVTAPRSNMVKYEMYLNNGLRWLMYVTIPSGQPTPSFSLQNSYTVVSNVAGNGYVIQVGSALPYTAPYYDAAAGRYLTGGYMTGTISNNGYTGVYRIQYTALGTSNSGKPLVMAAAHQIAAFTSQMPPKKTVIQLDSPSLGLMVGYSTTLLEMQETLPKDIGFLPYSLVSGRTGKGLTSAVKTLLTTTIQSELAQDMSAQTNLDSTYYSGKALDKFAQIVMVAKYILKNDALAKDGLSKLKTVFSVFATNKQRTPLAYDMTWRGVVSTLGLSGDSTADFGSSYFNDHHFHYGYLIHAAAVIGLVDTDSGGTSWIYNNRDFVNSLVRDVANPSSADRFFPVWRSFDWFAGHSWAKGLFESADGKDEESSSEDYHFAYGMKLWGRVVKDSAMEARGNLMLAVMKRSLNSYMLYRSSNTVMPSKILGNKVSGILFENKIDHTTYFGTLTQYTQGIHMLPITSVSSYIREPAFVTEEWNALIAGIINGVDDGWKGILMMNRALMSPSASLSFFQSSSFQSKWLDGGMSRTWALAYAAYTV